MKKILLVFALCTYGSVAFAQAYTDYFINPIGLEKSHRYVPFSSPRFINYTGKHRQAFSLVFPGSSSGLQLEYTFKSSDNLKVGLGFGYPFFSFAIETKLLTIYERKLSIKLLGGFNDNSTDDEISNFFRDLFVREANLFYDLSSKEINGFSMVLSYTDYWGRVGRGHKPLHVAGTYPAAKIVSLALSGYWKGNSNRKGNSKWNLIYSVGVSRIWLLLGADGEFVDKSEDYRRPFTWKPELGWNLGIGINKTF